MLTQCLLLAWLASAMMAVLPPAPRQPLADDERWAAVHAARMAGGLEGDQLHEAEGLYNLMAPGKHVSKFKQFAVRWTERDTGSGGVTAKKPTGRTPKLDRDTVLLMATDWTQQTVGSGARKRHYLSMEEVSWGCAAGAALAQPPPLLPPPALPPAAPPANLRT